MSKMLAEAGNGTRLKESNVAVAVGVQYIEHDFRLHPESERMNIVKMTLMLQQGLP